MYEENKTEWRITGSMALFIIGGAWLGAGLRGAPIFEELTLGIYQATGLRLGEYHWGLALAVAAGTLLAGVVGLHSAGGGFRWYELSRDWRLVIWSMLAVALGTLVAEMGRGEPFWGVQAHSLGAFFFVWLIAALVLVAFLHKAVHALSRRTPVRAPRLLNPLRGHEVLVMAVSVMPSLAVKPGAGGAGYEIVARDSAQCTQMGLVPARYEKVPQITISVPGESLEADILGIAGELIHNGTEESLFNWMQVLRGLVPHRESLRRVYLLPSPQSVHIVDECAAMLRHYLPADAEVLCMMKNAAGVKQNHIGGIAFVAPEQATQDLTKRPAVDLENLDELMGAYYAIIHRERDATQVMLDVTGSLRSAAIAGATMTLNNHAHVQYVRPVEVRECHLDDHGKPTTDADLARDILAYDATLEHRLI